MSEFLKHIPDYLQHLKPYQPGKTMGQLKDTYGLDNIINLANNENPLGPSPNVKHVITEYLDNLAQYPEDATPELKQQLASLNYVSSKQIVLGSGSSEILEMVIRLFLHTEGELLVSQYAYYHYQFLARAAGCTTNVVATHDYQTDLSAMAAAIDDNTRLIIIANPNNPTGTWLNADMLFNFIRNVPPNVIVLVDEAYNEYMDDPHFKSVVELLAHHANLIVVHTLSKAYGLAGLRFGYCVTSKMIADLLNRIRKPFNVASIALIAASAALDDTVYLKQVVAENQRGMQQLSEFFRSVNLTMIAQSCNFITVEFGDKAAEIAKTLEQRGVIVRTLVGYLMPQHLRISVGTMDENLALIEQLSDILDIDR